MELACEVFDRRSDARSGAIDGIADDRKAMVLHGVKNAPAGKLRESIGDVRGIFWMRFREDQELRLEANHFFEIDLRPILRRVDDGNSAGVLQSVRNEGVFADRNEGFG